MRALAAADICSASSPNTATLPRVGGLKPSSVSSSVVLPAPFLPSTPMMSPGNTSADTSVERSLRAEELRHVASRHYRFSASFFSHWSPTQGQQLFLADLELPRRQHELRGGRLELLQALRQRRLIAPPRGHAHRLAALPLEQALSLEQGIRLRDRHRIHGVQLGELAHRGQLRAGRELAAGDEARDLLDELPIDRRAGLWIQHEHECLTSCIYVYHDTNTHETERRRRHSLPGQLSIGPFRGGCPLRGRALTAERGRATVPAVARQEQDVDET